MNSASKEFFAGIRAELPIMFGVFPFGMIYGVLALDAGLTPWEAMAMALMVLAGSSQMVAMPLIKAGTPYLIVILTMAVVNMRHLLYSASIAPYLQHLRAAWKWLLAYLLTDEAYAVSVIHYQETEAETVARLEESAQGWAGGAEAAQPFVDQRHYFFLGAGLTLWVAWNISSLVGILLGTVIPDNLSLGFALSLTFIALMVPALKDRAGVAAAVSAGLVSLLAVGLPYKLGLLVGAVVGICVGMLVEGKK